MDRCVVFFFGVLFSIPGKLRIHTSPYHSFGLSVLSGNLSTYPSARVNTVSALFAVYLASRTANEVTNVRSVQEVS